MNQPQLTPVAAAAQYRETQTDPDFERLLQRPFTPQDLMQDDNLDKLERIAVRMAEGRVTVPEFLRGNVADCMAIAIQAMLWNMDPFAVAQKTHLVNGRLGFEAQLVNAVLQNSRAVRGLPRYEYRGDGAALECRVGFVPRGETEVLFGEWLSIAGITTKNSPLWKVNPKQQLGYLQIKNWARAFAPGAILGVYTVDELEDIGGGAPRVQSMGVTSAAPAPVAETTPPPPALPAYTEAAFNKNLASWGKLIRSGQKSADQIVATLMARATLSEQQLEGIYALATQAADTVDEGPGDAAAAAPSQPLDPNDPPY